LRLRQQRCCWLGDPMEQLRQTWADLDVKCLSLLTPGVVLVLWLAVDITFSYLNRWFLSPNGCNFYYIIFVSFWQALIALALLTPFMLARVSGVSWEQLRRNLFGISMLAFMWVFSQLCTSGAQAFLGSAMIEFCKCCMPLPTILFSVIFERDRQGVPMSYSVGILGSAVVVVTGACMAVFDKSQASALGYFLAIGATCMTSIYYVAAACLLKSSHGGLNALNLLWYVYVLAIPILLVCFGISSEPRTLFYVIGGDPTMMGWATLSGVGNVMFALLTFVLVGITSPLTAAVGEDMKRVIMIVISIGAAHSGYIAVNLVGLGIFVPSCAVYAYFVFLRRFEKPRERPPLEVGMGLSLKGKTEGSALITEEPPTSANVCCVVQ